MRIQMLFVSFCAFLGVFKDQSSFFRVGFVLKKINHPNYIHLFMNVFLECTGYILR